MDYLYLILFSTLLNTILASFKCLQSCPDTNLCSLAKINTTCIMTDVPCIRDYYSRDINQPNKPRNLIISTENRHEIISWEPSKNNYGVNYSGFEVTVVTGDGKRQIYYMKILRSVAQEIVSPLFRINCSFNYLITNIDVVCVQSLPKAFFLSSNSDADPKVCISNRRYDVTSLLPDSAQSITAQNEGLKSDGTGLSRLDENTNNKDVIIGAVVGSIGLAIIIIIVVTLYKFRSYNSCSTDDSKEIYLQTLPENKQEEEQCTDLYIQGCPVHGKRGTDLTLQCVNCRKNTEDIRHQQIAKQQFNEQSIVDFNQHNHLMYIDEEDKESIIFESDKRLFDINFK